jgi:hypothetical protein
MNDADHPGGAHAAVQFDAPAAELLRHHFGGTQLLETQLRVGMNVAPDAGNGSGLGEDGVNEFHVGARLDKTMLAERAREQKRQRLQRWFGAQ